MEMNELLIQKTPGVCGGEARIRDTQIAVWVLAEEFNEGEFDSEILENYPSLTQDDLEVARKYIDENPVEIERVILEQSVAVPA